MFISQIRTKCLLRNPLKFYSFYNFQNATTPYKIMLFNNKLFEQTFETSKVKIFMDSHVFAIWDYLTILKALQRKLASKNIRLLDQDVPDLPFLINQIVINEEIEEESSQEYLSALGVYQLYINTMKEIGADINPITNFVESIKNEKYWKDALKETKSLYRYLPITTYDYLEHNLSVVDYAKIHELAGVFFFGREDIHCKFNLFLRGNQENAKNFSNLKNFLQRHIDDDAKNKNPILGEYILNLLCKNDETKWKEVETSVIEAIKKRNEFLDGINELFERERIILF